MNTTEHYQLNQWEGSDRIMREDFNADNRKTEEALTELADTVAQKIGQAEVDATLKWVKIGESVLSGSAKGVSVSVGNAEQYRCFLLLFDVKGGTQVDLNWTGAATSGLLNNGWDPLERAFGILTAFLMPMGGALIQRVCDFTAGSSSNSPEMYLPQAATSGTVTVEVRAQSGQDTTSAVMQGGSALYVYGLRK